MDRDFRATAFPLQRQFELAAGDLFDLRHTLVQVPAPGLTGGAFWQSLPNRCQATNHLYKCSCWTDGDDVPRPGFVTWQWVTHRLPGSDPQQARDWCRFDSLATEAGELLGRRLPDTIAGRKDSVARWLLWLHSRDVQRFTWSASWLTHPLQTLEAVVPQFSITNDLCNRSARAIHRLLEESSAPKRRRGSTRKPTPLSPEQIEAVELVAEHKGNFTAAAKAAGKSRQAVGKLYRKATKKLGKLRVSKIKGKGLPHDQRGQVAVAAPEDQSEED